MTRGVAVQKSIDLFVLVPDGVARNHPVNDLLQLAWKVAGSQTVGKIARHVLDQSLGREQLDHDPESASNRAGVEKRSRQFWHWKIVRVEPAQNGARRQEQHVRRKQDCRFLHREVTKPRHTTLPLRSVTQEAS